MGVFSCALPTTTIPSVPLKRDRYCWVMLSLRCPLVKVIRGDLFLFDEAVDRGNEGFAYGGHES